MASDFTNISPTVYETETWLSDCEKHDLALQNMTGLTCGWGVGLRLHNHQRIVRAGVAGRVRHLQNKLISSLLQIREMQERLMGVLTAGNSGLIADSTTGGQ